MIAKQTWNFAPVSVITNLMCFWWEGPWQVANNLIIMPSKNEVVKKNKVNSNFLFENSRKTLDSLTYFKSAPSHLLISNWYFLSYESLDINIFYQYLVCNVVMNLVSQTWSLQWLVFCIDDQEFMTNLNYVLLYRWSGIYDQFGLCSFMFSFVV